MATVSIVIQTNKDASSFKKPGQGMANLNRIQNLIKGLEAGSLIGAAWVHGDSSDPVRASATATLATVVAANTITIGGTTLTASASPATEADFLVTGTDTVVAAALAACINAHSVLSKIVSATSALGVVTIYCVVSGPLGNQIPVTRVGAPISLSGVALTGGAGGVTGAGERVR